MILTRSYVQIYLIQPRCTYTKFLFKILVIVSNIPGSCVQDARLWERVCLDNGSLYAFDLVNSKSKQIHSLVKTDIHPKDKLNFSSCLKISCGDVLSTLEDVSDSYATQKYLRLLHSIILAYTERSTPVIDRLYHSWIAVFVC